MFKLIFFFKKKYFKYILSSHRNHGKDILPTLLLGMGNISIDSTVRFGYFPSALFFNSYNHIESRSNMSKITIGSETIINNNCNIVAHETSISIGSQCLIGINFTCFDSDFHSCDPLDRNINIISKPVNIGNNVFIGSNVTILKGVSIGNGSTVGANSVVTKSFPDNSIIAGNPAKLIRVKLSSK